MVLAGKIPARLDGFLQILHEPGCQTYQFIVSPLSGKKKLYLQVAGEHRKALHSSKLYFYGPHSCFFCLNTLYLTMTMVAGDSNVGSAINQFGVLLCTLQKLSAVLSFIFKIGPVPWMTPVKCRLKSGFRSPQSWGSTQHCSIEHLMYIAIT